MTKNQRNYFSVLSVVSIFVMAVTILFAGGNISLKAPIVRATNSGNYSVSFNRTICGNTGYNNDDFTKESQLSVSKSTVYAHVVKGMVTNGSDFARFKVEEGAYIEFYMDSNVSFQEITGFSFVYNSMYPNGDFDIYLSTDGSTYPASPNVEVRNAPATVSLSAYNVKKIKFAGLSNKYAYFNTITINYACGEAAPKSLSSISVSGQREEFDVGDTFEFGGTVTAHYSDSTSADVTSSAIIDSNEVNMSSAGEYEVGVSYSDAYGNANTSYSITVSNGESGTGLTGTYAGTYSTFTFTSNTTGTYTRSGSVVNFTYIISGASITFTYAGGAKNTECGNYRLFDGDDSPVPNATGVIKSESQITVTIYGTFLSPTPRNFTKN